MCWFCVSQSDDRKSYIQFWLWPGLSIQELDQNSERIEAALYNLTADPYERNDLSTKYPDVVGKLKERMQYCINSTVPPINKPSDPQARKVAENAGCWGPWQD